MAKKGRPKSASRLIEDLSKSENLTVDDAAVGLLRFCLQKATEDPDSVAVRDIGDVLQGAAKLRAAGAGAGDDNDDILTFFLGGVDA